MNAPHTLSQATAGTHLSADKPSELPKQASPQQLRRLRWALPSFAIVFVVALVAFWVSNANQPLGGVGNADGTLGGNFELTGHQGPVRLSDYQGRVVVVYFGFLGCNNFCDTSMLTLQKAINRVPESKRQQIQALMINIDPGLTDVQKLQNYTQSWHPQISGLIGNFAEIKEVTNRYGAFYERTSGRDEPADYLHTSRFFIVDQDGDLVDAMRHSTTAAELVARLEKLLDENHAAG
jgi:protein SCO1/2